MAIQSITLSPNAEANQTDDEIIGQINTGSASITREDALDQNALNIVKTGPGTGQHKVKDIQRTSGGDIEVTYDDVPEA